ncbi:non-ribosomal peptide synthetase [Streptomyces sp. NBC_00059]|uniref:non-ribosomal peptide synthetase n=1 Tax=Streptomyces sp. NBC_00059 TaxID=2975635 RepID=UPI0022512348|nr:non-ribosomal peptide synthetase [Streptomyces sp. NBC_00059]MCX5412438.1 amino acid adenylation domain-containing protein [Streptomyces sp. NBC_00059]
MFPGVRGPGPRSLVDLLRSRAAEQPDRRAYVFLGSDGKEESHLTYAQLDHRARLVAANLRERSEPGDRILILHPPGEDYLTSFFGCLYAGVIAVPAYPPQPRTLARLRAVVADASPAAALTGDRIMASVERRFPDAPELRAVTWLPTGALSGDAGRWTDPRAGTESLAFLQYTSGSTAAPKGVMVTHGNLLQNSAQIHRRLRTSEDSCVVSWLPPFHDMGLIGGILQPLTVGFPGILMAPGTFVLDPVQWLRAVSAYGATVSPVPPFALDLCVERVDPAEQAPLDLSTLETVVVGAEPVRTTTLDRFAERFAPWGLRREALRPSFGLAEATLMVSSGVHLSRSAAVDVDGACLEAGSVVPASGDPRSGHGRNIVGCGSAVDGQRLLVVDPATSTPCGPERVGEIWVAGPNVAQGYWKREAESKATFHAELSTGEGPFMRTGDLGFLRDGELFVTGRSKDLIIIRGRNLYPQDIERCAESGHVALQPNASAAVGIEGGDGTERLALIAELRRGVGLPPTAEVARDLVRAIASEFDVRLHELVLVRAGTIPKTSSGKIQRRGAGQALLDGTLTVLARWTAGEEEAAHRASRHRSAVEAYVADLVVAVAPEGTCRPDREQSLLDLGLESLSTLRLIGRIERDLGVDVSDLAYGDDLTVAGLADAVVGERPEGLPLMADGTLRPAVAPEDSGAVRVGAHEPFPQTDTQQAYCLGRTDTFELGNVSTHAYLEFDAPELDLPRFEKAWRRVIGRHEMLRSVMLPETNEQRILAEVPPYDIRVADLRGRGRQEAEAALAATRDRLSHEVRPAGRWPLFEVAATRLDSGLRIHLSVDALIADFSSGKVLFRDLSRFYEDPELELPAPTASFRDYVRAGTARGDGPEHRRSHDYWWSRLPALPPAPELPTAAPARSVRQPRFTRRETVLPAAEWQALKARAAGAGLTPTGLLLAVYAEVLAAWSNSRHFTLNVPRLNRPVADGDFDEVIGQFASFTLLEVDHRAPGTFQDRARRLQQQLRADLRHQEVSGVEVLRELMRLQGGFDRALMPVVMTSNLAFTAGGRSSLEKLLDPVFSVSQTPQVSLDYQVQEDEGALLLNWDVVEELFPAGLVDGMFAAHSALLHALSADGDAWSRSAPLALPAVGAGASRRGVGPGRPVPAVQVQSLFEAQVATRPDAPAVIAPDRVLSYGQLSDAARQAGRWLCGQGARPNRLVAIVMEKGWEQVVAAYAVLFSGAAYLPVDPGLPTERIHHLLDRGEVDLVLTQSHLDSTLDWPSGPLRLCLDRPLPAADAPLPSGGGPDDLVYTMFTSGSTGEPKGVMVNHRALVNCLTETAETFRITAADRALAVAALHHDLSVFDLFGVLGAGGTLVVPAAAERRDPAHWAELVVTHGVTVWNSVPAMMEMLLESVAGRTGPLASLRLAFLGGDWIPLTVPGRLAASAPGAELVSVGGPTETTLWSIWYRVGAVDPGWRSIPYGAPIANVTYHLLDERLRECPDWVTGEMYVSGVSLADGYWRDPERTDAVFIGHPDTGERMYRTGDLGRWRPDGTIEFMGRADFQVKIHGQRIELGEIETALLAHPDVASAVVTAVPRPDRPGHDGLAAYVVAESRTAPQGVAEFEESRRRDIQVLDPVARAEFKLARHGLRREPGRLRVLLAHTPEEPMRRRSDREFLTAPVTLAELSGCLGLLRQAEADGLAKCRYPSAGGLYPVQTYVHVKPGAVTGLPAGAYYLDPRENSLVSLAEDATIGGEVHAAHNRALYDGAGFSLFLIADRTAIEPMYGPLTRDLCLLEAGYMGQLLMDRAARTDIGLCPIGELSFGPLRKLFALDDGHELVHALVGGRVDRGAPARTAPPAEPLADRLRGWLRERLPAHMVPEHVTMLESWPLSANGKVDRLGLPAPRKSPDTPGFVAPRTPTEEQLVAIWCELLDLPRVGVRDNFFELGGHSLAATRLISRVRDRFRITISLREVFTARTVAELAVTVDRLQSEVSERV